MLVKEIRKDELNENAVAALKNFESSLKRDVPSGYVRIELSTKGLLGAPSVFHVRNFDTREVVELSLTAASELPLKLASILDRLIYEKEVSVRTFHENEVVELLVKLFTIFYEQNLELDFPWNEEDLAEIKPEIAESLRTGVYKPKVTIDLAGLKFYPVTESTIRKSVEIVSKTSDFRLGFSYPKFGDTIIVKKYLNSSYREEDKKMEDILKRLEVRKRYYQESENKNLEIDVKRLPYISPEEIELYSEYEMGKALFAIDLVRALHLESFMGQDVSQEPLSDKIKYIKDPRVSHNVTQIIEKEFKKMQFGVVPDLSVRNPLTGKPCIRRFLFRPLDILQAFKEFESDEYDVRYE